MARFAARTALAIAAAVLTAAGAEAFFGLELNVVVLSGAFAALIEFA